MKKQLRKALAIICAVAFAVTGITFTPQSAQAGSSWIQVSKIPGTAGGKVPEYTLGDVTDTDEGGIWTLETANNEWKTYTARYKNAEKIADFTFDSGAYNNRGGAFLRLHDMFNLGIKDTKGNDLISGVKYNVKVSMQYFGIGDDGTSDFTHYIVFQDNYTNELGYVKKTVSPNSEVDFDFQFTPKSSDGLNMLLAWSNKYASGQGDYSEKGLFTVKGIAFTPADDFKPVPANEDYQPDDDEDNPWTVKVQYQPDEDHSDGDQGTYGAMSYKIDPNGETLLDSTYLRVDTAGHDDASTGVDQDDPTSWWWWNGAELNNYADDSGMSEGKSYEGTVHFNYTAPDPATGYSPQIRMIFNGDVKTFDLEDGDNELPLPEFEYGSELPKIEFNFDLLENGSIIQVSQVELTQVGGNWVRVPEVEQGVPYGVEIPVAYDSSMMHTGVVIHNWQLFNGYWGGEGCKLYYDNDLEDPRDPLKIKIGAGNRWEPASAQVKLTNTDAYQELEDYTNYYMYYTFTSTQKGTVHINQEGYDPEGLERVDITDDDYDETDGLYHVTFKKIFTVLPESTGNLTMFCTGTTYGPGGVVLEDGDPVPEGTIFSDFKITYSRQDKDYWTLVTDSRHEDHQNIDDIVPGEGEYALLRAYANSWNKGRMSYKAGYNADGANDVAKMGIRLDQTAGSQISGYSFDEGWGLNLQIPNASFYNRNDTNGNELVNGKTYKLRFYYKVELPKNTTMPTASSGLILAQQGYRSDQWARYNIGSTSGTKITKDGLYMAGGSITPKSGSVEDAYIAYEGTKDGGIDFTYDSSWNEGTRSYDNQPYSVMVDFSEFPEGTKITGIDWEFYAPGYNVYIDGTRVNEDAVTEDPGSSYTFPTKDTPGFENAVKFVDPDDPTKEYQLGQTVTFDDFNGEDIVVNTVRQHEVTIDGEHNAYVIHGENYTFPTNDDPGFEDVKEFTDGTNTYPLGSTIGPVESDLAFQSVPYDSTKVEIRKDTPNGELLKEASVRVGSQYTLPEIQNIDHYEYKGQNYNAGQKVGPFTEDPAVIVAITSQVVTHTITIVNEEDPDDVLLTVTNFPDNTKYQLPDLLPDYDVDYYIYDKEDFEIGESVGPITTDTVIYAVLVPQWIINIDGEYYDTVRDGDDVVFPSGPDAAKIGYISVDGGPVIAPGGSDGPIKQDRDYLSINSMTVNPKPGASIYLNDKDEENKRGIAFGAEFTLYSQTGDIISYSEFENVYKSDSFKLGTMITTQEHFIDYFHEELTLEQVAKAKAEGHANYIKNIMNDYTFCDTETPTQNFAEYRAGIINLNDYNITRNFIARSYGYVQTKGGDVTDVVYADYSEVRSIKQVAINVKANAGYYNSRPEWERDIMDYCAAYED